MKKLLSIVLMIILLTGCSNNASNQEDGIIRVGVLQLLTHDALDASYKGFVDGLKDNGFIEGENLEINYQNPEGDPSNLSSMADSLVNSRPNLLLAIATTPAQNLMNVNTNIPLLATAITDFEAAGLANDLITGVSDACLMEDQLALLLELKSDIKTLGIIYTSSEPNSEIQAKQMEKACKDHGINALIKTVSDKTMIDDTLQSFKGKIDALYVPTDNNIASAMGSVSIFAIDNQLPVLCGESNPVKNGGLISLGVDYYKLGKQTADMASKILRGEKTVGELKVETQKDIAVYYNSDTAAKINLIIPDSILERGIDVTK